MGIPESDQDKSTSGSITLPSLGEIKVIRNRKIINRKQYIGTPYCMKQCAILGEKQCDTEPLTQQ